MGLATVGTLSCSLAWTTVKVTRMNFAPLAWCDTGGVKAGLGQSFEPGGSWPAYSNRSLAAAAAGVLRG
jgi:hypothetical protein